MSTLTSDTMLPDLLTDYPQVRRIFDRYGLRGCGGRLGPVESVGFFARTHDVEELRLLDELRDAIVALAAPPEAIDPRVTVADTIYRRFFTAAIVSVLTAGATWGAFILWQIGRLGRFNGVSLQAVNAHGQAQIYGWMALCIMGFGYQAFSRIWHTELVAPRAAIGAFVAMVAGLVARTIGMTMDGHSAVAVPVAIAGCGLQLAALLTFAIQIAFTFRRSLARFEPYVGFIFGGLVWLVAMSALDFWHTYTTMTAATHEQLLWYVATYQAPLRDLQVHGVGLFMILGVCLRHMPAIFGVAPTPRRRAWSALAILTTAVVGETVIFVAYRWSGNHAVAAFLMIPWLFLAVGAGLIAVPWKLWRPLPNPDRSAKFVRAAYAWLALSLTMLLLLPAYQAASHIAFSHAYYGAIRHAITVGFISLMIMGFAAKIVPTLNGVDPRKLTALWGPFVLINVGCFLRVTLQTLTDWFPASFKFVGVSGLLEVSALAWWGVGLIGIMVRGKRAAASPDQSGATSAPPRIISADHRAADVLGWFPQTAEVFDRHGFSALRNPVLRRTVGRGVTLAMAAALRGVDVHELLGELNGAIVSVPPREEPHECGSACGDPCHSSGD